MASVVLHDVAFDSPEVQRLLADWNAELAAAMPAFTPGSGSRVDAREFSPPDGVFLLAALDERPVACGGVRRLTATVGEVKRLFVVEATRGRGVGRALLDAIEARARALGFAALRLDTAGGQEVALRLFRTAGYHPIQAYNDNPDARF